MTGVYAKFSIRHKGPGKLRVLHDFLLPKYQKAKPSQVPENNNDITALAQEIRRKVKDDIHARCGKIRVLDMEQPIGLGDIYTKVNILEKLLSNRRLGIDELLIGSDIKQFDRLMLGKVRQKRVLGVEAVKQYDKLMILGKPGAGKTTFMKRLATLCNQNQFQEHRVPVFVTLKEFAEAMGQPGLQDYITKQWSHCGIDKPDSAAVLKQGLALILLDGLDEVQEAEHDRVLQEIKDFTRQFRDCQFVMTCRIAAREYVFQQFTEVEVADFDADQITEFATKWFKAKKDDKKEETFIQRLESNKPIKELATNPLLLTLLCLVFGEAADFPANRAELYKEGLDVLLKKWDAKRNIERDRVYKKLSLKRKEDLLSQLAFYAFDRGDYFFKQAVAERQIVGYIRNLPGAQDDEDALHLDGTDVLNSIEAQHGLLVERAKGIYSFSHLTFQEYFTAKQITRSTALLHEELAKLSGHIVEKRYREIFLLTVGMLPEADDLLRLMKQNIDQLLADDPDLQKLLSWLNQKLKSVDVSYREAAIRAFYLDLYLYRERDRVRVRVRDRNLEVKIDLDFDLDLDLTFSLDLDLFRDLYLDLDLYCDLDLDLDLYRILYLDLDLDLVLDRALDRIRTSKLKLKLEALKDQLPGINNTDVLQQWWKEHGKKWIYKLRSVIIEHRNIGHDWQFTEIQKEKLQQYY
ncbi:NACHT domain-containing NTPase, partial [Leptolyngbya cf. ectocarpi LEGE 11479]|nr:NACHT domain-containing NTPase [Leptolyngbya cf. ectocarpi LEGE 11479]